MTEHLAPTCSSIACTALAPKKAIKKSGHVRCSSFGHVLSSASLQVLPGVAALNDA